MKERIRDSEFPNYCTNLVILYMHIRTDEWGVINKITRGKRCSVGGLLH